MITYKEAIKKIDEYLSGKLKREEIVQWARESISHRDSPPDVIGALATLWNLDTEERWRPNREEIIEVRDELHFIMKEGTTYERVMKENKKIKENPWQIWKREKDGWKAYLHKDIVGDLRVLVENSKGEFRYGHLLDEKEKNDDGQSYMVNDGWTLISQNDSKSGVENLLGDSFYYDEKEKKWK